MWISPDGRIKTNAFGDPESALEPQLVAWIRGLSARERADLIDTLWAMQEEFAIDVTVMVQSRVEDDERLFENEWLPDSIAGALRAQTTGELVSQMRAVPIRWRLDAVLLVEQVVDY